ncbi:MAG: glycosyltransferase family 1 protein [Prosthecochloris sp.]|uniref:glycosyltransferase family 4 protein n=1 Tax=Prosthecochloris sp. TaxID=290513 RepID=UPI0013C84683|nr:glycosyltransferase family 4 protein [Prosthecochloris sp.]NEX13081.1 glycosyltransferase family 1 protein [Prosthecochloris sp.]
MKGRDWNRYRYGYVLYHLWKALRKTPNATVITTTWELGAPMTKLKKLFPECRYIVVGHGLEVTKIEKTGKIKCFNATINSALTTIAESHFTQEEINKRIYSTHNKAVFLPNGVDTNRFFYTNNYTHLKNQLSIAPDTKIILTLARVIERKGHDTLLRAMPKILARYPNTVYIIAGPGHGTYIKKLNTLIKELGLSKNVRFTSFVDNKDLNAFYSMSDIYVMVSRILETEGDSKGFGITFLEANACGCPVIGSYSGGIPDAVENDVNGFLIQPDDPDALAIKIIQIFDNKNLRQKLADQGLKRVQTQFTWETVTDQLLNIIKNHSLTML